MPRSVTFPALPIEQPIGKFFVGVMKAADLTAVSYADVRRMEETRDVEKYLGIQRRLSKDRVKEIRAYAITKDATFPTAVILAVQAKCALWDAANGQLTLSEFIPESTEDESVPFDKIAKILDGQHRVDALIGYNGPEFELNVAIFVDADIAEQANVFATVNLAQTKVNKSLVYDLFDLARARSPQKSCHNIAVALNGVDGSPLFHRIKRLGVATEGRFTETITQATFVESLLQYISSDPGTDRDLLLRNQKLERADSDALRKRPFRNLFIDNRDEDITEIVWNYFEAAKCRWPHTWERFEPGNILIKTNGFRALMRFLRPAYLSLASSVGDIVGAQRFQTVLAKSTLQDADFNVQEFSPGTSGESKLVKRLLADSNLGR